jgi:hypothetical protein
LHIQFLKYTNETKLPAPKAEAKVMEAHSANAVKSTRAECLPLSNQLRAAKTICVYLPKPAIEKKRKSTHQNHLHIKKPNARLEKIQERAFGHSYES